jgi:tetratricopeptide (TPR) repeat protein
MASQEQGSLEFKSDSPESLKPVSGPLESLHAAGLELFAGGRYADAETKFAKALQLNRSHLESLKYLGLSLYYQEKYAQAVERFNQCLAVEPDNREVLMYCGAACIALIRYIDADRHYRRAISLDPQNVRAYLGLGHVLYRRGLYADAVGVLRKGNEVEKDNAEILFSLGEANNKLDQIDLAVSFFEAILEIDRLNPRVFYNLGILYDKKSLPAKASEMYRMAKELSVPDRHHRIEASRSAAGDDLFFSRSLTVVDQPLFAEIDRSFTKAKYDKFRKQQVQRKPHKVLEGEEPVEQIGTMDLTKASLKINEAIKIIKEKNR